MTGLVDPATADDQSERGGWRGIGWLCCGAAGVVAIGWYIVFGPGEAGSKSDWFFGAVVLCVVLVSLWQTANVQRQANRRAAEAVELLRVELVATERRSVRELELAQELHKAELETRQKTHQVEMEALRQRARLERTQLLNQLQRQAVVEVSRAVNAHTQMLATLWSRGASILQTADRDERERAMLPLFEQIGQVVNDFSVEIANAHQIVEDSRLDQALEGVNEAVLMAIRVAQEVCDDVLDGRAPEPNPIPPVQRLMREKAADARRLAWNLLRTGLGNEGSSMG